MSRLNYHIYPPQVKINVFVNVNLACKEAVAVKDYSIIYHNLVSAAVKY